MGSSVSLGRPTEDNAQIQKQKQLLRAKEASKQMLFGVFGNLLAIIEEFEQRTINGRVPRSAIALPDQKHKDLEDIRSIVQTQILLFETQNRVCLPEVKSSINSEMRQRTLIWAAVRSENNVALDETDAYIAQLYEILVKGKTKHECLKKPPKHVNEETIRENFQHIMKGKHDASVLDESFKVDPTQKATAPATRQSSHEHAYRLGAQRIVSVKKDLEKVLQNDVKLFEKEVMMETSDLR